MNIDKLNKISHKLSLNHLLRIFSVYNIPPQKMRFEPVLIDSTLSATILRISKKNERIYIDINVFKLKPFAELETKYQKYIRSNNDLAIEVLEYGIRSLLYRYIIKTKELYRLTQDNAYIKAAPRFTIDNTINALYKALSEDYCTIINYEKELIKIKRPPSLVGQKNIGNIYLGGYIPSFIYLIKVNIIVINKNNNDIKRIKNKVKVIKKSIKNNSIRIKLNITIENNKPNNKYAGYTYL
ncbi:type VI secretion system baseplate protein IglJ [Francisella sp. SYW-2]|uniref:type VI secretion system baseplate protein IglJ n=1 Tax=Francisella sp. SYW-2 TaxID=2610886 RepID=UPI00123CF73A|nr:type VI secretion system baseplate protein IglJ [Francisella sp. SYW-2]